MWEQLQYDLNHMGTCSVSVDPLHEIMTNIDRSLDLLNPVVNTSTRSSVRCTFPISNLYIPDYPNAPIFTLNVDLRLFRCLLWYKGFTGLVSHYRINEECLFLLQAIQFMHAVQAGTTVEDAYIQHLSSLSLSSEKITIIRQRIKTSLKNRFSKSLTDVENVINTLLTTIGNVPTSLDKYSQIPLQEGDIFSFYGHIYTDIPDINKFAYRIDLYLTDTPVILSQYSQPSSSATITDTFILMSRTASLSDLRNIVRAYIPSNLSSTAYREVVLDLYPAATVFSASIQEADMYTTLYTTTGHYIYEMYSIYIWANITLYYHLRS